MVNRVDEFRAAWRQMVPLPSGLVVMIRKIQSSAFLGLGELPIPRNGDVPGDAGEDPMTPEDAARLRRYSDRAIAAAAVIPRFSDRPEDIEQPHCLHVSELPDADYLTLSTAIFDFVGLGAQTAAAVEAFRPDEERSLGAAPGTDV